MRAHFDLAGRHALVTGSSRGIGRAIALGLAEYGADVVVHCAGRARDAEGVAEAARAFGVRATVVQADLAHEDAAARLVATAAERQGPLDILVLNASIEERRPWAEITPESFRRQSEVNLRSTVQLLQLVVPGMVERRWGRVVTLGSIQQVKPNPAMWVYAGNKAAQLNMARSLALQVAPHGVTVNNLAPGAVLTERNEAVLEQPGYRRQVEERIPMHRVGSPDELVGAALLLCSDAGRYITGADLFVDGGWHAA